MLLCFGVARRVSRRQPLMQWSRVSLTLVSSLTVPRRWRPRSTSTLPCSTRSARRRTRSRAWSSSATSRARRPSSSTTWPTRAARSSWPPSTCSPAAQSRSTPSSRTASSAARRSTTSPGASSPSSLSPTRSRRTATRPSARSCACSTCRTCSPRQCASGSLSLSLLRPMRQLCCARVRWTCASSLLTSLYAVYSRRSHYGESVSALFTSVPYEVRSSSPSSLLSSLSAARAPSLTLAPPLRQPAGHPGPRVPRFARPEGGHPGAHPRAARAADADQGAALRRRREAVVDGRAGAVEREGGGGGPCAAGAGRGSGARRSICFFLSLSRSLVVPKAQNMPCRLFHRRPACLRARSSVREPPDLSTRARSQVSLDSSRRICSRSSCSLEVLGSTIRYCIRRRPAPPLVTGAPTSSRTACATRHTPSPRTSRRPWSS